MKSLSVSQAATSRQDPAKSSSKSNKMMAPGVSLFQKNHIAPALDLEWKPERKPSTSNHVGLSMSQSMSDDEYSESTIDSRSLPDDNSMDPLDSLWIAGDILRAAEAGFNKIIPTWSRDQDEDEDDDDDEETIGDEDESYGDEEDEDSSDDNAEEDDESTSMEDLVEDNKEVDLPTQPAITGTAPPAIAGSVMEWTNEDICEISREISELSSHGSLQMQGLYPAEDLNGEEGEECTYGESLIFTESLDFEDDSVLDDRDSSAVEVSLRSRGSLFKRQSEKTTLVYPPNNVKSLFRGFGSIQRSTGSSVTSNTSEREDNGFRGRLRKTLSIASKGNANPPKTSLETPAQTPTRAPPTPEYTPPTSIHLDDAPPSPVPHEVLASVETTLLAFKTMKLKKRSTERRLATTSRKPTTDKIASLKQAVMPSRAQRRGRQTLKNVFDTNRLFARDMSRTRSSPRSEDKVTTIVGDHTGDGLSSSLSQSSGVLVLNESQSPKITRRFWGTTSSKARKDSNFERSTSTISATTEVPSEVPSKSTPRQEKFKGTSKALLPVQTKSKREHPAAVTILEDLLTLESLEKLPRKRDVAPSSRAAKKHSAYPTRQRSETSTDVSTDIESFASTVSLGAEPVALSPQDESESVQPHETSMPGQPAGFADFKVEKFADFEGETFDFSDHRFECEPESSPWKHFRVVEPSASDKRA